MDPSRWQQIEELYHAALECEPGERAALLARADPELRREIESLLAQQSGATPLDHPAWEGAASLLTSTVATLTPGTQLGPYKIEGPLAAGGMGEVFRATDTRLGRSVAVKTSREQFSERFNREARAISSLNHPHICTLYDVGPNYLVMELCEGETLAARLKKGKLSLQDTLRYGTQIADALAAAHAKGIVHRDLKPGNVMVTKTGVKVLDFGLAKSSQDETITASRMVMGTPAYMAPEQRERKECDARTDIYSLGLVLYEMATGKRLEQGQTPSLDKFPPPLAHVIERCLATDPEGRWHSATDLKLELEWVGKQQPAVAAARAGGARVRWGIGVLVLVLALGWAIVHTSQSASGSRSLQLDVSPPPGAVFNSDSGAAISPDGGSLAFVARSADGDKLWIRPLNSVTARALPGTDGAMFPFWSPDSRSIGFFAAGKLQRVEVSGGPPTVICAVGSGRGGTWNSDGEILFNSVNDGPLLRVLAKGGTPVPVTAVETAQQEDSHRWPHFLPGGRRFLYFIRGTTEINGVYLGSLDRPTEKIKLLSSSASAIYAPAPRGTGESGHILWVQDGNLMAQAFDAGNAQMLGTAAAMGEGVGTSDISRLSTVSVSNDGTLFYSGASHLRRQMTWYDRSGKVVGVLAQPEAYIALRISPDAKRVALVRDHNIWQIEFTRGIPARVTRGDVAAIWSPDSKRLVYINSTPPNLFMRYVDSTSPEERLTESRDSQTPLDWSSDGRFLLYASQSNDISSKTQSDLWLFPMIGNREPVRFTANSSGGGRSQLSSDGKWIAYTSHESARNEIYVTSFPVGGPKWQVSSKGGDYPRWRKDGQELYYVAPDRKLMSVTVKTVSGALEFSAPSASFSIAIPLGDQGLPAYTYDVMPDGQRFLVLAPASEADSPSMTVVTNWQAELSAAKR